MARFDIRLVPGMDRGAPSSGLHQEGGVSYARILNNLRPDRGELARRPGSVALSGLPTLELPGAWKVVHFEELSVDPDTKSRFLLATEGELFIGDSSGWSNVTPEYTTGTVTVTNASTTVTGSGTAWLDRGIYGASAPYTGNWFKGPDGSWYRIASVASNTSITLATSYSGSTTAGAAYTIRRTMRHGFGSIGYQTTGDSFLFTHRINQDLYVGGWVSGGLFTTANAADGGVIKVVDAYDAYKTSWSPATYVVSGRNDPTGTTDSFGYNIVVRGLGGLADGRLVLPIHFYRVGASLSGGARVAYSSHLDTTVWTTSPGGATDIVDYRGSITASSIGTTSAAIHFEDGIEIAELTGQDDPPLRFRPSGSSVGAIGAKMLMKAPSNVGREIFLGADLRLYAWNGVSSIPVDSAGLEHELSIEAGGAAGVQENQCLRVGFMALDSRRNEIAIFCPEVVGDNGSMREVRYNYLDGTTWRGKYPGLIYCATALRRGSSDGFGAGWRNSPPTDQFVVGTETDSSWLWRLSEAASSDGYDDGRDSGGIYALFEGIDGGKPETTKVLQEILVYLRAPFHATPAETTLKLKWYSDDLPAGDTVQTATTTPARTAYENDYLRPEYVAVFRGFASTPWRMMSFILASNDDDTFAATISGISIFYEESGDVRAS